MSAENLNNVFHCGQSGTFHDGSILSAHDSTAEQIAPTVITEVRGLLTRKNLARLLGTGAHGFQGPIRRKLVQHWKR